MNPSPTPPSPPNPKPTHLILICCHAIYIPSNPTTQAPSTWLLASFQKHDVPTFISHIHAGLDLLASTPSSLLILSGGPTHASTPISEAASYLTYMRTHNLISSEDSTNNDISSRIHLEERALDSYHNLLLSLLLFRHITNTWPAKITIISHLFKKPRFMDLHVPALKLHHSSKITVDYIGLDPAYMSTDAARAEDVKRGEWKNGYSAWEKDRHGKGEVLRGKRDARDGWGVRRVWWGEDEEGWKEREESGVKSEILERIDSKGKMVREEVLTEGEEVVQPWE